MAADTTQAPDATTVQYLILYSVIRNQYINFYYKRSF